VRRTLAEKLARNRVYECTQCGERQTSGGWLLVERSRNASCPSCGSFRINFRRTPDKIDRMYTSPSNFFKRIFGGVLYKCRYCRLQFYDLRPLRDQRAETPNSFSYHAGERRA
jgi:DNA-directed RNA polymerase subunit RPC12/RpoP